MIGLLRFAGLLNAAVWLGAALFFTLANGPALNSVAAQKILGPQNFDYFSGALWQITLSRLFYWNIVCALVALLHLVAEWLYLGRTPTMLGRLLPGGLLVVSLFGGIWLAPKLRELHLLRHATNYQPEIRQGAAKSFHFWHGVFQAMNVLMIAGIAVYFWRAANPPDELRFVGSSKFRG